MKGFLDKLGRKLLRFDEILGEMLILLGQTFYFFREAPATFTAYLPRWRLSVTKRSRSPQ